MEVSTSTSGLRPALTEGSKATESDRRLLEVSQEMEASFLSEMLKHAGVGKVSDSFGGGIGEEQFSSLLRDAQAREIAAAGGLGLAESIFESLKDRNNG